MRSDVSHGRDLNPTAASLLGLLADGPRTGWDLAAAAEYRVGGFWTVTRSQVDRELADMSAAGLVDAGATESRDRRAFTALLVLGVVVAVAGHVLLGRGERQGRRRSSASSSSTSATSSAPSSA